MLHDVIHLAEAGFSVIWLKNRQKAPVEDKWTELPVATPDDLRDSYIDGRNVGVRLGEPSRIDGFYLHVIDLDIRDDNFADSTRKMVENLLKTEISDFQTVISGSGGASRHLYFLADQPYRSRKLWHTDEKFTGADGKKHWAAEIELFGTGKQVVLPPSIHPDTGKPYRWQDGEIDISALPVIDGDLLDDLLGVNEDMQYLGDSEPLGLSYEEVEDYLSKLDLPTWCDDRVGWIKTGMAVHHEFGGNKDAFKVWCDFSKRLPDRFDLKVAKEQWRSFGKSRRTPVTFATIIEAANEIQYLDQWDGIRDEFDDEEDDEPAYDRPSDREIDRLFKDDEEPAPKEKVKPEKRNGVPAHLLTIPGTLGTAVAHYNKTSTKTQPQFAVQAALALGSVVCARHWTTNHSNFTSLYLVNLGETGGGKEFSRKFVQNALTEADMTNLIGPNKYASEAAFMGDASWKPRHVVVYDEFGRLLKSTGASANTHLRDVQSIMMSAFGILDGQLRPTSYSRNGKTKDQIESMQNAYVIRPAITMLGLSVPEHFYDALSQDEIADGFLNRLLVVNSREVLKVETPRAWKPIPAPLREWIRFYGNLDDDFSDGESAKEVDAAQEVPFTADAEARLIEVEGEVIKEIATYREMRLNGLWSRSKEIAQRIALIVALSKDRKTVGIEEVNWAWDYVRFYTEEMCDKATTMLGASPIIRVADHLAEIIEDAGHKGMSLYEMGRISHQFDRMSKRDKEEVLERLTSLKRIVAAKVNAKRGRGRPTVRYLHEDFLP